MAEQQPIIREPTREGDVSAFISLVASIIARCLHEDAQAEAQEQPANVVSLPERKKRTAS